MVSAEYTAAELAAAAGMTTRNVRSYRQRGLLEPPRMYGRKGFYGPEHLAQLRTVRALLARGLSLNDIVAAVRERHGEQALELLLMEPAPSASSVTEGRLGELMPSTLETLALQRPGATERLLELGILQLDEDGRHLVDTGLLARANELLSDGTRVRVMADVSEAAALGAHQVGAQLLEIAELNGAREPRSYIDLATWAFREALRHRLSEPRP